MAGLYGFKEPGDAPAAQRRRAAPPPPPFSPRRAAARGGRAGEPFSTCRLMRALYLGPFSPAGSGVLVPARVCSGRGRHAAIAAFPYGCGWTPMTTRDTAPSGAPAAPGQAPPTGQEKHPVVQEGRFDDLDFNYA